MLSGACLTRKARFPVAPSLRFDRSARTFTVLALGLGWKLSLAATCYSLKQDTRRDERQAPFIYEQPRERASYLGSRIVRDRVFRRVVCAPIRPLRHHRP